MPFSEHDKIILIIIENDIVKTYFNEMLVWVKRVRGIKKRVKYYYLLYRMRGVMDSHISPTLIKKKNDRRYGKKIIYRNYIV